MNSELVSNGTAKVSLLRPVSTRIGPNRSIDETNGPKLAALTQGANGRAARLAAQASARTPRREGAVNGAASIS